MVVAETHRSLDSGPRPSLGQLIWQFVYGSGYLLFASVILTSLSDGIVATRHSQRPSGWLLFARTLTVLSAGTLLMLVVALIWLVRWARSRQVRQRQFGLVSVFLSTALL